MHALSTVSAQNMTGLIFGVISQVGLIARQEAGINRVRPREAIAWPVI